MEQQPTQQRWRNCTNCIHADMPLGIMDIKRWLRGLPTREFITWRPHNGAEVICTHDPLPEGKYKKAEHCPYYCYDTRWNREQPKAARMLSEQRAQARANKTATK